MGIQITFVSSTDATHTLRRLCGFTLIEIMIVLALLVVLLFLAYPSYTQYITRAHRSDAMIGLETVANEQEQYFLSNNTYANNINLLPINPLSPDGHYTLGVVSGNVLSYILLANPGGVSASGRQAGDGRFRLQSNGTKRWDGKNDGSYSCTWTQASTAGGC